MKDISLIPKGVYCYTIDRVTSEGVIEVTRCPYWSKREDKDEQENGYCSFLEEGDWEGDGMSLLWDSVKECGENIDD